MNSINLTIKGSLLWEKGGFIGGAHQNAARIYIYTDINISRNLSCEIIIKYFIDETDQVHKYYHCESPIIILKSLRVHWIGSQNKIIDRKREIETRQ